MKEIGEALKEARENIGISIEEAANDLKLRPSQIENIESGNVEAFKDVFYLKYFVRDYAKYLGLSYEDMVDEFNEYLFDCTSKISLEDIKQAQKKVQKEKKKEQRICSPYTIERKVEWQSLYYVALIISILILIILLGIYYFQNQNKDDQQDNSVLAMSETLK